MRFTMAGRRGVALMALAAASTLFAAGCSAGSLGSSSGEGAAGATEITLLTGATDTDVASAKAVIEAFQAANPNITIKHDTRPGGSEGDNLVKTRLATGDMSEVFIYNNGSLLQALKPEQNLTPLDDQPWVGQLDQTFADSSKGSDGKLYGGAYGTAFGGGVLYNIPLYKKLGLEIPLTWDDFMKNNEAVKKDGSAAPVEQTYGETWTSQLFVLGDYPQRRGRGPGLRHQVHRRRAEVRHDSGRPGWVPAHPAGRRRRLLQQGLRLGRTERRYQGGGHRNRRTLSAARRQRKQHRERRSG